MPHHHASARFVATELPPVAPLMRARLHQAARPGDEALRLARQPAHVRDDEEGFFWLPDDDGAARPAHAAPEPMPAQTGGSNSMMPAAPAVAEPVVPAVQVSPAPPDAGGALAKGMLGTISGAAPTVVAVAGLAATGWTMAWAVDHRSEALQPSMGARSDGGGQLSGALTPSGNQATAPVGSTSVIDQGKNDQSPDNRSIDESGSKADAVAARPEGLPATTDRPVSDMSPVTSVSAGQAVHAENPENSENTLNSANAANAANAADASGDGNAGHASSAGADQGDAAQAADAGGGADSSAAAAGDQPDAAATGPTDTGAQSAEVQASTLRQIPEHLFKYYSEAFLGDGHTLPYLQVTRIVEYEDENGVIDALRLGGRDEPLKVGDLIAAADYDKVFWDGGSNRGGLLAMAPIREDRTPYIAGYESEFDIPSIKGLSVPAGHAGGLSGSMMLLEVPPDQSLWVVG